MKTEIDAITRAFPDVATAQIAQPRRKSHMSAANRKAQSLRMKLYWRERRKARAKEHRAA